MDRYIEVLRRDTLKPIETLGRAHGVGYTLTLNGVATMSFSMPDDDPKRSYCAPKEHYLRIVDGVEHIGPFRIVSAQLQRGEMAAWSYQCEHVLATLMDNILPGYHQIGNLGVYTREVLAYILGFQRVQNWTLGRCAFDRQFEYAWTDESLLAALWSVPKPIVSQAYMWVPDTSTYPWTLNLDAVDPNRAPECYIKYGKNLMSMTKSVDMTNLCTRLWARGAGEGVNQLTIADVNGGVAYLDAPPALIERYGLIERVFVDRRFELADSLKAHAGGLLAEYQEPYTTYDVAMVDLSARDDDPLNRPAPGKLTRIEDEPIGEDVRATIIEVRKPDAFGAPMQCDVVLANKARDIAGSIAEMASLQRIEQLYSQGATNIYSVLYADNAGPGKPATLPVYVPEQSVNINGVQLYVEVAPFRAYETGAQSGGGYSHTDTSSSGGGSYRATGGAGGGQATSATSDIPTTGDLYWNYGDMGVYTDYSGTVDPYHRHYVPGVAQHTHKLTAHSHTVYLSDHTHSINIPDHSHDVEIYIPNHTHAIIYGIYEGSTASSFVVRINGRKLDLPAGRTIDTDIAALMADETGSIPRGQTCRIEIEPNTLTRIVAMVTVQLFVQSHGGKIY